MGQRRALGNAPAPFPAHRGISLAGRPHRARDAKPKRAPRRSRCSTCTKPSRATIWRCRFSPARKRKRTFSRRGADALHRGHGAGPQSHPGRHLAFPRAEFSRMPAASNFRRAKGKQEFAWTTSWGVSTRLIGTVIMAHADDDGLVLPPRVAPTQIVIIPSRRSPRRATPCWPRPSDLAAQLRAQTCARRAVRVHVDQRDLGGGVKNWEWIKKGVPLRVEIGPRDLEKGSVAVTRRDQDVKSKSFLPRAEFVSQAADLLAAIQQNLLERARAFRDAYTVRSTRRKSSMRSSPRRIRPNRRSTAASPSPTGTAAPRSKNRSKTTSKSPSAAFRSTIRPVRPSPADA